jgi:branched-chain amino acid transport system ATP-binding protein
MLRIEGLTSGYSAIPVLNGVSIKVEEGQFVAIVGPNGAGKTTLFKTISGIVRPSAGAITFEDRDLLAIRPAQRAHLGIAHVPEGRQVFPSLTVMENLEMGAMTEAGQRDWKNNIERIFEWLPILAERRGQFAGTLSGGQQQMLAIARALLAKPALVLMDEPSLGLSPKLTREIFDIVVRINRERGVTILLVEQNAHMALKIADFGYVLEVGRIVMEDTGARLAEKEDIREFYLGMKAGGVRGTRRWKRKKLWR